MPLSEPYSLVLAFKEATRDNSQFISIVAPRCQACQHAGWGCHSSVVANRHHGAACNAADARSAAQERFGKPPEVPRTGPDDEEGLSWASAAALPRDFDAPGEDAGQQPLGPYLPLMGSLGAEADAADAPDLQLCVEVGASHVLGAPHLHPAPCVGPPSITVGQPCNLT